MKKKEVKPGEISPTRAQMRNLVNAFYGDVPEDFIKMALSMKKEPVIKVPSKSGTLAEAEMEYLTYASRYKKDAALKRFFSLNPDQEQVFEMYNKAQCGLHRRLIIRGMFNFFK